MSHYYADRLDAFAELATSVNEERYLDASDPDNIVAANDFFEEELGFLSHSDKSELKDVWDYAVSDCRNTKLIFNAIKVLKEKYDKPFYKSSKTIQR